MTAMTRHLRFILFVTLTTGLASTISLLGGIGLEAVASRLLPLVPLIIALPSLNDIVGDYASIIAAHASDPAERPRSKRALALAIMKVIWINVLGIVLLSLLLANRRGYIATAGFMAKFVIFVSAAIVLVVAGLFTITTVLDKVMERRQLNPDDVLIPIVTSIADVMMLGLVTLAAYFLF
jgi:cation transporter-like permease